MLASERFVRPVAAAVTLALLLALLAGPFHRPAWSAEPPEPHEVAVRLAADASVSELAVAHGARSVRPLVGSQGLWVFAFATRDDAEDAEDGLEDDPAVRWFVDHLPAEAPSSSHRSWAWFDQAVTSSHRSWAWFDEAVTSSHRSWAWPADDAAPADHVDAWRRSPIAEHLQLIDAQARSTGHGVRVAILDTGLDRDHPAFATATIGPGWDLIDDDPFPAEPDTGLASGHGTHVAGLVNLVAPEAVLLPYRVVDADGQGSLATLILGIELAVAAGADVINISLGTAAESDVLEDVIEAAEEAGVVLVAAAGNREGDVEEYPARFNEVVAVAAVDAKDTAATFTSDGDWIDVAAPGVEVLGPHRQGGWALWSGTSMAAPLVSGQAALLRALDRDRSAEDVVDLIVSSVAPAHRLDSAIGEGRADPAASVTLLTEELAPS